MVHTDLKFFTNEPERDDFNKQKIIFQEMVQSPSFMLDTDKHFLCLDTGRIIVGKHIKYLLALMNSNLFFFMQSNSINHLILSTPIFALPLHSYKTQFVF